MTPEDLQFANLKESPFRVTPGKKVTVWAGHKDLKKVLEKVVILTRNDKVGTSECVVLYGELGTGKSHSLRFFQNYIDSQQDDFKSKCVYLETLRVANKVSFCDLYRTIVQRIGKSDIQKFSKALVSKVEEEKRKLAQETPADEFKRIHESREDIEEKFLTQAKDRIMGKYAQRYSIFQQLDQDNDGAWFYISASQPKFSQDDLVRLDVMGPIDSDFAAVEHLGMIINLMCGIPINGDTYWKAFYLFLDEVEIITDLEPKALIAINQSLRDLFNACPEHLCLLLGLTGDAAMVEVIFSQYLLSRLTREPICIPSLDDEQAVDFLKEVLKSYRIDSKATDDWHPFTEEAVRYIIYNTTDKTPRRLFYNCKRVFELSASEGLLKNKKKITKENAERFLE